MILFHYVKWKNFLSTGNKYTTITLDSHDKTLFMGINGSGKSTVLDALTFALFGKSYRRINKPKLVNSVNQKDCVVEVEFTTTVSNNKYKIIRGISPSKFLIYCNGKQLNQDSQSKDQQDFLEKIILRMNYKSFTQIVALGSASFTPFMQLPPADRRAVTEEVLDIEVFTLMNSMNKQRAAEIKNDLAKNKLAIDGKEETIKHIEKNIADLKKNNENKLSELRVDYAKKKKELKECVSKIKELKEEKDTELATVGKASLKKLRARHTELISLRSRLDSNKGRHEDDIKFYKNNDTCPTCEQNIDEKFKESVITKTEKKVDAFSKKITAVEKGIDGCLKEIDKLDDVNKKTSNIEVKIAQEETKQQELIERLEEIVSTATSLENSDTLLTSNNDALDKAKQDLNELFDKRRNFSEEKQMIEIAANLLKDGGIKTKIIKQYIPMMNTLINKYLSEMNFFVNFTLDENFQETIKSRHLDEFSYENFSEGEKFRINLAILIAWRTIAKIKNSVNCNILFFDEIFDSSLDAEGLDGFVRIMYDLQKDANIFVISHKADQLIDKFDRVCKFEKKKNHSIMMESE